MLGDEVQEHLTPRRYGFVESGDEPQIEKATPVLTYILNGALPDSTTHKGPPAKTHAITV